MRFINEQNEKMLLELEYDKSNLIKACEILENAVIQQFQTINLGLLSEKVFNDELNDDDLLNFRKMLVALFPDDLNIIEDNLTKYISNGIYTGKWKSLELKDLGKIEIVIIGKSVHLWDMFEINEQLSALLSDYRVYYAGAMSLIDIHLREIFDKALELKRTDARFIVGIVGTITITQGGRVYEFIEETVSSPYLDNRIPGFAIGNTAIIRREIANVISKGEENIKELIRSIYSHEVIHTFSYSSSQGFPYATANWEKVIRRDICRFLKKKREKKEIEEAFLFLIENKADKLLEKKRAEKFVPFWSIFNSLLEQGIIIENEGVYSCLSTKEEQLWDLI